MLDVVVHVSLIYPSSLEAKADLCVFQASLVCIYSKILS